MLKKLSLGMGLCLLLCGAASLIQTSFTQTSAAQTGDTSAVKDGTQGATAAAEQRPFYYSREITPGDLNGRTLRELALLRNTIYARAGNKFRKKWLNDYFAAQSWYHPLDKMDESKLTALDRKNAGIIAQYDAAITKDRLVKEKAQLLKAGSNTPEDKIELRLLSERLGTWSGEAEDRTPLSDSAMLDKQLTVDQLADLSRRDLRLLRNTVYARRGRVFKSELLHQYFASMDWYKPDPKYTDTRLTEIDNRNIKLIRSVEDQLGGPLSDLENKQQDGWFANA